MLVHSQIWLWNDEKQKISQKKQTFPNKIRDMTEFRIEIKYRFQDLQDSEITQKIYVAIWQV